MAFEREETINRIPTEVRTIEIILFDGLYEEDHPEGKRWGKFEIRVDDQFGQPMNWKRGDIWPHLTSGIKQQLLDFMAWVRNKAEQEILP